MKNKIIICFFLIIFLSMGIASASDNVNHDDLSVAADNIYVNGSFTEDGNGSIDNPFNNMQSALHMAENNSTIYVSSGVYSGSSNTNLTIDKSLNLVNWDGKDVIFDGLNQSNIFRITSKSLNVNNIIFKNANSDYGSALFFENGLLNSNINATFLNNHATVDGGAIFIGGETSNNVFNGLCANNTAYRCGVAFIDGESHDNIFNATYTNNHADFSCGVLFFTNSSVNDIFCGRFIGNTVTSTSGSVLYFSDKTKYNVFSGDFINNTAQTFGAIVCDDESSDNVFSGNFFGNHVFADGAAVYLTMNVSNSIFSGNFSNNIADHWSGGAVCLMCDSYNCTYSGYFANNYGAEGGAITFGGSYGDKITGTFLNNSDYTYGGALFFPGSVSHLYVNATFINNSAQRGGGAIGFYRNFADNVTDSIFAGTFINNSAKSSLGGGAIYLYLLRTENIVFEGIFINNTALSGGAIYINQEKTINNTIINSNFISNKANSALINYTINDINLSIDASLKGQNILINAIYSRSDVTLNFVNVSYWGGEGIVNSDDAAPIFSNLEAGQNLTLEIYNGDICVLNITNVTNNDGYASFDYSSLDYGNYTCLLYHGDDDYYTAISREFNLTINPFVIEVEDLVKYYSAPDKLVVNLTDREGIAIANQSVVFNINGRNYTRTTDENGSAALAINLIAGEYPCVVYVNGSAFNVNVTVLTTVNGTDITKVFRNATQYYATFLDSEGNYLKEGTAVRFNINGVMYDRQVSGDEGLAKLNINLIQGEYIITAMNLETGEFSSNNITVIPRIIENENITKYFRNATQYTVKVIGDDGNPVGAGEVVRFNINGVFYERATNESGIAKLNINLNPGDYIITAEYNGSAVSNNIKVLPVLTADDLDKKYGDSTPFEAKLVDGEGNPYSNQTVGFNINGVLYNRTTDGDGIAKLNINLQAGEYIITSSYDYAVISNKITVRN